MFGRGPLDFYSVDFTTSVEELYCFNIVTLIYKYSDGLKKVLISNLDYIFF